MMAVSAQGGVKEGDGHSSKCSRVFINATKSYRFILKACVSPNRLRSLGAVPERVKGTEKHGL